MRWDGFPRSMVFAALAAFGALPWLALGGTRRWFGLYLVVVTTAYVAGLVPRGRRRLAAACAVAALGGGAVVTAHTLTEVALVLAVVLGIARSAFLYRTRPARALVTESVLVALGLVFARFLAGPTLSAVMLAIWGFFLVQSVFFLVGGVSTRVAAGRHPDPFEEAHGRAMALLRGGV